MVGSDSDSAGGDKAAEELVQIGGVEEASFLVSFFWPGVWEIDVETFHGVGWYEIS